MHIIHIFYNTLNLNYLCINISIDLFIPKRFPIYFYSKNVRNRRSEVFYKKAVLKNLGKFTGKHLREKLFQQTWPVTLEKMSPTQMFSDDFAKFSRTAILQNTYQWYQSFCQVSLCNKMKFFCHYKETCDHYFYGKCADLVIF